LGNFRSYEKFVTTRIKNTVKPSTFKILRLMEEVVSRNLKKYVDQLKSKFHESVSESEKLTFSTLFCYVGV
jgi:hypothetical protein